VPTQPPREVWEPEQALLLTLLRQALFEARGVIIGADQVSRPRIQAEATLWIQSHRGDAWSFVWVCHMLQVDPDYIRRCRDRIIVGQQLNPSPQRHRRRTAA